MNTTIPVPTPAPQLAPPENHLLAIISLVSGILGWTLLPFLGSVAAVICGHLARADIRRSPTRYSGDGLAVAGLVLGWLAILFWLAVAFVFVAFFGGMVWLMSHA